MRQIVFASLVAIAAAAPLSSAFASEQFDDRGIDTIVINNHEMKVHAMRLTNGSIVYAMTREQLQQLNAKWMKEAQSTDGSGR